MFKYFNCLIKTMNSTTKNLTPADKAVRELLIEGREYHGLGIYRKTIRGVRDESPRHIYVFNEGRLQFTYTAEEVLSALH